MMNLQPPAPAAPAPMAHLPTNESQFDRWLERATQAVTLTDLTLAGCEQATPLDGCLPTASISNVRAANPALSHALLAACSGRRAPSAGTVRIGGVDLWASHAARRSLFLLAWVGQALRDDRLDDYLSVRDNLMLPLLAAGERPAPALQRVRRQLSIFDLAECASRSPADLSDQQRRLAVLCRALVVEPTVLFIEAPEQALDAVNAERLRHELSDLVRERCTCVVMATDDARFSALAQTTLWVR